MVGIVADRFFEEIPKGLTVILDYSIGKERSAIVAMVGELEEWKKANLPFLAYSRSTFFSPHNAVRSEVRFNLASM